MESTSAEAPLPEKPLVLIADTFHGVAAMLGYLIELTCGCNIVLASNGEEAVRLTLDRKPAAVVLDVAMPGIGGIEAARRLRIWMEASTPLLIALTTPDNRSYAREAGVFDHVLGKPVEIEALTSLLDAARLNRSGDCVQPAVKFA